MRSKWKVENLGKHVFQVNKRNKQENENIPVYSVTNRDGFELSEEYFTKQVFSKNRRNYKIVERNEFAYNPSRVNVGSIDFLKVADQALVSPLYVTFACDKDLSPEYLKRYIKSKTGIRQIRKRTTGAVRDTLKYSALESIKMPLPEDPDDQIRIASILFKADSLISKRKESIRLLDDLLKSTFLDMFGDPVRNERGWDRKTIKEHIGNVITGNTPPRNNKQFYDKKYIEWIKTDNIFENKLFVTKAREYLSELGCSRGRVTNQGTLLVTCIAGSLKSIGTAALTDRKVAFNQQINAIEPFDDVDSLFLYWLVKLCKRYIQNRGTKGMKKIITKSEFQKIMMIKPPRPLQNKFSEIAKKVQSLRLRFNDSLTELENLYGSLSQGAFRGELDLSKIPLEIPIKSEKGHLTVEENELANELIKRLRPDPLNELLNGLSNQTLSFEELWDKLQETGLEELPSYNEVKSKILKMLEGDPKRLSQVFDEDRKRIVLGIKA